MPILSDTAIKLCSYLKVGVDIRRPFSISNNNQIKFHIHNGGHIMENNKTLDIMLHGKSIRFFRSLKGVSCRELAEISGVKQSSLHKFETGRRKVTKLGNFRIMRALQSMGFEIDELLVLNLYVIQKHGGIVTNE